MRQIFLAVALAFCIAFIHAAFAQTDPFTPYDAGYRDTGDFKFRILQGADLPGNDIRSGLTDPELKGISALDCLNLCVAERMCGAFTYNENASVCFLKKISGAPSTFTGAISGIKYMGGSQQVTRADIQRENGLSKAQKIAIQAQLNALGHKVGKADGDFGSATRRGISSYQRTFRSPQTGYLTGEQLRTLQERDVYAETLVRLEGRGQRMVARSATLSPEQCEAVQAKARQIADTTRIEFATESGLVGQPLGISYNIPRPDKQMALYLMVAFDQPVRFAGGGFYGLLPEARAPFDIGYERERTRAVFPLYMTDTAYSGAFQFVPLELGETAVDAALVVVTGCGERVISLIEPQTIWTAPGLPEFVIVNEFATSSGGRLYRSPTGERLIEELDGRFRILDAETNLQVSEYVGLEPRFSPTGRFVAAYVDDELGIYDAIDGKEIRTVRATHVAWDNRDSFVVVGGSGLGLIWTYPSLGGDAGTETGPACRVCSGVDASTYRMDLENNVVIATGNLGEVVASITTDSIYDTAWGNGQDKLKYGSPESFISAISGLAAVERPKRWQMIEKLQFSHIDIGLKDWEEYKADPNLLRFVIVPSEVDATAEIATVANGSVDSRAQALRGATALPATSTTEEAFTRRLADDFGFRLASDLILQRVKEPMVVTADDRAHLKVDSSIIFNTDRSCMYKPDDGSGLICDNAVAVWTGRIAERSFAVLGSGMAEAASAGYSLGLYGFLESQRPGHLLPLHIAMPHEEVQNPGGGCGGDCGLRIKLVAERYVLVWSNHFQRIEIFDRKTGKTRAYPAYRGDLMKAVYFSADLRSLLQVNSDGTFAIHALDLGVEYDEADLASYRSGPTILLYGRFADDEIVVWSKNGLYDATYEGAYQVFLRFPGTKGLFTFDQFEPLLKRPGLMTMALGGEPPAAPEHYDVPPIIDVHISAASKKATVSVNYRGGSGIQTISIFQGGKLSQTVSAWSATGQTRIVVDRQPGTRWMSVVATGDNGLSSTPLGRDLGAFEPAARLLSVLAIGVDVYDDPALRRLGFAARDAQRFHDAVSAASGGIYSGVDAAPPEGLVTKEEILAKLDAIIDGADNTHDIAIFYAGHGLQDDEGRYYLALKNTESKRLEETGLPWSEISKRIGEAKGRVTVFLDSCHSGEAGRDLFSTNDQAASSILERSASGVVVIAASKGREQAIEQAKSDGGLFTVALSAVLGKDRARYDTNGNGAIEASELYRGVKTQVWKASGGSQTPWMARNRMIGDFALF